MEIVKVKVTTRFFVECPECGAEHDVDTYYSDEIECVCGTTFRYDNRIPEDAEQV